MPPKSWMTTQKSCCPKERKPWDGAEDQILRSGIAAGRSCGAIAGDLPGRTSKDVWLRIERLRAQDERGGAPGERKPWDGAEDQILRSGIAAGRSCGAIAGDLPGRTSDHVRTRIERLRAQDERGGAPGELKPWEGAEDQILRAGVAAGHSYAAIAGDLPGRTCSGVRTRIERLRAQDERGGAPGELKKPWEGAAAGDVEATRGRASRGRFRPIDAC